ncbi:hypothetical protein [Asticcacaulis sp. YBE204]|uniref:hypothetical protein n=1 Tax=Asticcacaulis sp. YBE204 TaxID=1282363 RepID=UPI0003C3F398|nr:hypothetical protein [Asticcacaulis sp. YBE204]ESQ78196.1 hypothetical protein AEYBE204_15275 [Asticcacaulis sp. YBE204]
MILEYKGKTYRCVVGSDVIRDGMYIEVSIDGDDSDPLIEIFYSDVTHDLSVTVFQPDIALAVLEWAISVARERLLPSSADASDL